MGATPGELPGGPVFDRSPRVASVAHPRATTKDRCADWLPAVPWGSPSRLGLLFLFFFPAGASPRGGPRRPVAGRAVVTGAHSDRGRWRGARHRRSLTSRGSHPGG